jgi:hypothetical protein
MLWRRALSEDLVITFLHGFFLARPDMINACRNMLSAVERANKKDLDD